MQILITGGTGFIGAELVKALSDQGHKLVIYTRGKDHFESNKISYTNSLEHIGSQEYFDCFINLAGESMAGGRWTEARKAQLIASRIETTRALVDLARRLNKPPAVVLSASAIGFYGHQGDHLLTEDATPVAGFSHSLCRAWEEEASKLAELGCRVCVLRLGVVLSARGGAMEELTRSARMGVATWLGNGKQWLSWVHRDDVIAAMQYLVAQEGLSGVFNVTAPEPETNRGFCQRLRSYMTTLVAMPVPSWAMRLLLGEMADELLLNGQRVVPTRLQAQGFVFRYKTLDEALPSLTAR